MNLAGEFVFDESCRQIHVMFDKEVCCQCVWWGRGKKLLFKKKAKINYLLVLQFVDCVQHVSNI